MNAPISINDDTRQRYLREMGVTVYFPRRRLPGAAASRRYTTGAEARAGQEGESGAAGEALPAAALQTGTPESRAVPSSLDGLKDSLAANAAAGQADRPPPSSRAPSRAPAMEAEDILSFRFTWFRPDERLGIIAGHEETRLPSQSLQMLQRILAALSPRYRGLALQGEAFHWPLDVAMPGDVDTARQVVRAFLRRRYAGTPPPFLLVLMDEPPLWLFPPDAVHVASTMMEQTSVPGQSECVLRVPALGTMARDASAKRPAWDAMQSLIRPLAQTDQE